MIDTRTWIRLSEITAVGNRHGMQDMGCYAELRGGSTVQVLEASAETVMDAVSDADRNYSEGRPLWVAFDYDSVEYR